MTLELACNGSAPPDGHAFLHDQEVNDDMEVHNGTSAAELTWLVPIGSALYLLSFVTFVGNAMVMHAFRTEKRLQTVSNMFIMSLAAADLIVGLFVMPLGSLYAIKGEWLLGLTMCRVWLIVDYIASTASILNLCILSLDRYWSITAPLKYLRRRTKRRALAMISSVWLLSSSWIWPVAFFDWLVASPPPDDTTATVCETGFAQNLVFKVVTAILNFYIPWVSMMYLYVRMFSVIRQRSKLEVGRFHLARRTASNGAEPATKSRCPAPAGVGRPALEGRVSYDNLILMALPDHSGMVQYVGRFDGLHVQIELADDAEADKTSLDDVPAPRRPPAARPCRAPRRRHADAGAVVLENARARPASGHRPALGGESPELNGAKPRLPIASGGNIILQREKKAAVQLGVIMGAFILCWLPYSILFVAVAVCGDCVDENIHTGSIWLGYLNSTLNPALYPLCNANFKRAFKRMLGVSRSRESRRHQSSSQAPRMPSGQRRVVGDGRL